MSGQIPPEEDYELEDGAFSDSRPISALAPTVRAQEESQVEVSASPAFQCLEELFDAGKITGTRMAELKAKYTALHDMLKQTRESENKLLQDAKRFTVEMEKQKMELDKADHFPENIDSEVGKLRQELLKRNNDIQQIEEREYELNYKITALKEELRLWKREYERIPKPEEMDSKKREVENQIEQTKKENAQRILELKNLKEDLESKERQNVTLMKELEEKLEEMEALKNSLVQTHGIPTQIAKEVDKMIKQKSEVSKKRTELQRTCADVEAERRVFDALRRKIEHEKMEVEEELDYQRETLEGKEREYNKLMKDFEFEKEREAVLLGDRAALDLSLRHVQLEKKTGQDTLTRKQREKDRDLRQLKKLEQQWKIVNDALAHQQAIYEKVKDQALQFPRDDQLIERKKQIQAEVDEGKRKLGQQNALTSVEQVKVEDSVLEEEKLIKEQEELRAAVIDLTRLAQAKADEREQKSRDYMRAEQRYHNAVQDLKAKNLSISDHHKKKAEVQVRLHEFAKLYDVIKNERNKCVNQIQASKQKAAEMREKIKILSNEVEILRTTVSQIEKSLQKERLKNMNSLVVRDSLRNERTKAAALEDELNEKREQFKMEIGKLNTLNNQAEEGMVQLRKKYETTVQHRNDRGVQLVEREEEVCIFYEKFNIQETMIRNGDVSIQAMDEEIRFLNLREAEEQRQINLARKNRPNMNHLNDELVTLQIQLSQCQDRMADLEKELEDPDRPGRIRLLQGKDPNPTELRNSIESLEIRLAEKEENLLERDLVFEQVIRITERVEKKVDIGRNDSLTLAKKVNSFQARIKEVTRKMMGLVAELAMKQAETMQLQQESKSITSTVQQSYTRMEQGEPPSDEIGIEWEHSLKRNEVKKMMESERIMSEQEELQYQLPGGTTTTAEPRPNAYIPDDDTELPIPRPYGAQAPFKPTESGSTMRHIRKPILRPIEI